MQFTIPVSIKESNMGTEKLSLHSGVKMHCWIAVLFAEPVVQLGKNESSYCSEDYFGLYDSCVPSRFIFSLTDLSHF